MVEPNWSANVYKGAKSPSRFQSHLRITTRQFLKPCTQLIIKIPVFSQDNVITTFVVIIDKPPDIFFCGMIRKLKKVNLKKYALVMICKLCIQKYTSFWKWVAFPFHGEAIVYQEHLATVAGEFQLKDFKMTKHSIYAMCIYVQFLGRPLLSLQIWPLMIVAMSPLN